MKSYKPRAVISDREVYAAIALWDGATCQRLEQYFGSQVQIRRSVERLAASGYIKNENREWVIAKSLPEDEEPISPDDYPTIVHQPNGRIPPEIAQRGRWQI